MRVVTNVKARQTKAQENGLETLEGMIKSQNLLNHKVLLFLLDPGRVDKNIAGLIANKFMAKYQRPVCLLTRVTDYEDEDILPWETPTGIGKISYQGSARGCEKVGITDFKTICADTDCVMYCTGHPNAFGLGIEENKIDEFI